MKFNRSVHHLLLATTALLFFFPSLSDSNSENIIASLLMVFIGTLFIYRLSVWVPIVSNNNPFISFYSKPNVLEFLFYILFFLASSYFISTTTFFILSGWGIVSSMYFTNVKIRNFELKGLRSIPLIKTLLLAFMWTVIGYVFTLKNGQVSAALFSKIGVRFLIIFLICLGVDLRDIEKDKQAATNTLATYFGFNKLKSMMLVCNAGLSAWLYYFSFIGKVDLFISCLLFFILLRLKINHSKQTFTLLLDGTLFLYSLLHFIASYNRFC
jgi:hypothetical protein